MRLTLRTMLAYMDDLLEPSDHQDVGQKIEESEFASNLLHRVRDVTRMTRLGVPKLSGPGMGLDPNTVAEYLDNSLAAERVPDFEKVCLESDVHLAEVAACHQILTLVLGEPADIEPAARQRMYDIGNQAPAGAGIGAAGLAASAGAPPVVGSKVIPLDEKPAPARPRPEVPDYLRSERRSRFLPLALTVALACGLVVAVALAAPQNPVGNWIRGLFGQAKNGQVADNSGEHKAEPQRPAEEPKVKEVGNINAPAPEEPPNHEKNAKGTEAGGSSAGGANNSGGGATAGAGTDHHPDKAGAADGGPKPVSPPPTPIGPATGIAPAPNPPALIPPAPGANGNPLRQATAPDKGDHAGNSGAGEVAPSGKPQTMGRLITADEVLLRMGADRRDWRHATPETAFVSGDRLVSLPTFRPAIALASGVTLQLWPETQVHLDGITPDGTAVVRLEFGRMLMLTSGKANVRVKLELGAAGGTLTFSDPDAIAAAEVIPYLSPGTDPESHPPKFAASLYATTGQVVWLDAAAGPTAPAGELPAKGSRVLRSPMRLTLAASPLEPTPQEHDSPKWMAAEAPSSLDVRAARQLGQALEAQRSVTLALGELADDRRTEMRALATRALTLLDEFDKSIALFNDSDQRRGHVWQTQMESLQGALARGPAVAAKVRQALEKEEGKNGGKLYRMLWGYTKEQLQNGAAAELVDGLDADDQAIRVFSFLSLMQIGGVGGPTFDYRPEASTVARANAVRRWREQLTSGKIAPRAPTSGRPRSLDQPPENRVPPPPPALEDKAS